MVLLQLAYPGAPVIHSIETSLMDPRTGGYLGDAGVPMSWMAVQLAHSWNVPVLGGGSVGSGAPDIGWSSGVDGGMGATTIPLYAGEICGYLGLLDGSMVLYPEQTILQNEMCMDTYDMYYKFEFDPADLALDIITKVGPRGHFLAQKHTRKHIRDFRLSKIVGKKDDDGEERDPREVALEEFKRIAETHHPQPLPEDVLAELEKILAAAEREAEKIG
jgi:trimethylamine--corrinoid protein Co-methyltransferase